MACQIAKGLRLTQCNARIELGARAPPDVKLTNRAKVKWITEELSAGECYISSRFAR